MATVDTEDDIKAIEALIARRARSLGWSEQAPADWEAFADAFAPDATLFPAASPLRPRSVESFVARMKALAGGDDLRAFEESVLGTRIHIFGSVAVAVVACGMAENRVASARGRDDASRQG